MSDSHGVILEVLVLTVHPVEQDLFLFVGVCETDELALENDDSVLLVGRNFGNQVVDVAEHSAIEGIAFLLGSVVVDGSVSEVELALKDAV